MSAPLLLAAALLLGAALPHAQAVPLYNRQTGQSCAACHTAPPELTPFGRRFMLHGFTMTGGKTGIPLSGFAQASLVKTAKAVDTPREGLKRNDNVELERAKAITGGRISDSVGAYAELVYDGVAEQLQLGNIDLRYADSATLGNRDVVYGVTLHNNPGFQDPWNSTLARTWPFVRSAAQPSSRTQALLDGPLAQRVLGAGAYVFVDDAWYAELGAYRGLRRSAQDAIGHDPGPDTRSLDGAALYARVARETRVPGGTLTVGASLLDGDVSLPGLGGGAGTDGVRNLGLDALYQWQGGPHEATLRAAANRERWSLATSVSEGFAARRSNRLEQVKVSASWLYMKRWSGTVGVFRRSGSTDPLFYATRTGRPDTEGVQLDAFMINPLFPPPAWHPGMRTRIGLTLTHYARFDGARRDHDFAGRDASDNDSAFLYLLWAF